MNRAQIIYLRIVALPAFVMASLVNPFLGVLVILMLASVAIR